MSNTSVSEAAAATHVQVQLEEEEEQLHHTEQTRSTKTTTVTKEYRPPLTHAQHGVPGLLIYSDDVVARVMSATLPASPDFTPKSPVASKDVTILSSPSHPLWARIFLPHTAVAAGSTRRLPLVLYFHGGGFVMWSCATPMFHRFCERLAQKAKVMVVSVEYRLAPEHRLPAAYEDAMTALKWLQLELSGCADPVTSSSCEPWLKDYADPARCYVMGDSSGANIVHHLSFSLPHMNLGPLKIQGLIIVQPFIGGTEKTAKQILLANDKNYLLKAYYYLWNLALPKGVDQDHPMCNPFVSNASLKLQATPMPRILLVLSSRDPLCDRHLEYCQLLRDAGKDVKLVFYEDSPHGFYLFFPHLANLLAADVAEFMQNNRSKQSRDMEEYNNIAASKL